MKKWILWLLVLVILSSIGYYSLRESQTPKSTPIIPRNTQETIKIIAFGDSLTAGFGVNLSDSYPSILENTLNTDNIGGQNFTVVNMGVSGETSTAGLERVQFVTAQSPDMVLLGLGANDMLRSTDPSITRKNLDTIIAQFVEKKIPIVLLGMQSASSNGEKYRAEFESIYPDLAKKYTIPLVPFFLQGVALDPSFNTADGIHPNRAGYEKIIRENLMPVLKPFLEEKFQK